MIEALISSKTRIKLLLKFFLNSKTSSYLRSLATEFDESTNAIRLELNRLEKAGLLSSSYSGNKKMYCANKEHPLYDEIHNILIKHLGIDKIIENIIMRLGNVEEVYLLGDFAKGKDASVIDLMIVGNIDQSYLTQLINKVEGLIKRKIRYLIMNNEEKEEFMSYKANQALVLLWKN